MKKRILFVDDEELVLQGLQRSLRVMRQEWDMEFLDSGHKALTRMAELPFDLVVTDMLMPGMNGVELLRQVKDRFPKTVRLILSGHAERQLVLQSVGLAHQYLAKPCEAEILKTVLVRATDPNLTMTNERLMSLIGRINCLPSVPTLYLKINEMLKDPEVSMDEIGAIIAKDIGMTAKILSLTNSAFFGLSHKVSDPAEAASYLGIDVLKSLVLSFHVFSQFEKAGKAECALDRLRNHSLVVSGMAEAIMQAENASRASAKESFTSGILHDIGKLVLMMNFPGEMNRVAELMLAGSMGVSEAECEVFGSSHDRVGGYLLGLWGLPSVVVEAVSLHHSPSSAVHSKFGALTAVHVADFFAHQYVSSPRPVPSPRLDRDYLAALSLEDRLPKWDVTCREMFSRKTG